MVNYLTIDIVSIGEDRNTTRRGGSVLIALKRSILTGTIDTGSTNI